MKQSELDHLVEQVTQQVLAALGGEQAACSPQQEGFAKVLVVGDGADCLPEALRRDAVVLDIEDYRTNRNILRYDKVVIAKLNITQLADIAQGRIGDEVSCAVLHALLNGIDTLILENALSFRKFAGKGSTALYHLLESYAQTLQVFGVKPVGRAQPAQRELPPPKPPKFKAPTVTAPRGSARPNEGCLVTEAQALAMVKAGEVCLPEGAILTPSARDVFAQAGVTPGAR